MAPLWSRTLLQHLAVLLAGGFIGWLYDAAFTGVLLATTLLLAWHLYHLYLLETWLRTGGHGPLPSGNGPWSQVLARIESIRETGRFYRTSWRQLLRELRASTKAFPDGGVILNADNEIIRSNKIARRLLGLKKRRDRGARIDNLIRHPDFVAYLERGAQRESVEIPSPAGNDIWLSCRVIPYGMDQRLLLVRDISRTVQIERMRRDFVANASHELRSPLTVIAGYLDVMADDDSLPETWRAPVRDMRQQSERMSQLVRDLLQLSKLESSRKSTMERRVDMARLLHAAQRDALLLAERPREIELDLASTDDLLGEETELQSVISNLVGNAVRYTPAEGRVTIGWRTDDDGGYLTVADTGIGIPEEDIPRITERFYRADSGRIRQKGGTGLGLAIVKHALKRHDAELEIRSQVGKGSQFICHFPRARLAPATGTPAGVAKAAPGGA